MLFLKINFCLTLSNFWEAGLKKAKLKIVLMFLKTMILLDCLKNEFLETVWQTRFRIDFHFFCKTITENLSDNNRKHLLFFCSSMTLYLISLTFAPQMFDEV